jgi:hypothetical protein
VPAALERSLTVSKTSGSSRYVLTLCRQFNFAVLILPSRLAQIACNTSAGRLLRGRQTSQASDFNSVWNQYGISANCHFQRNRRKWTMATVGDKTSSCSLSWIGWCEGGWFILVAHFSCLSAFPFSVPEMAAGVAAIDTGTAVDSVTRADTDTKTDADGDGDDGVLPERIDFGWILADSSDLVRVPN